MQSLIVNVISKLMTNMMGEEHIFGRYLRNIKDEEAQRLKALLGDIVDHERLIDRNDRATLAQTLKQFIHILLALKDSHTFYQNINLLCESYEIYLPVCKYSDQLGDITFEDLIQKLKQKDVEGRGQVADLQNEMRVFVQDASFNTLLNDFSNETGSKLRALMSGFVANGWVIGLLNLMEASKNMGLNEAIDASFDRVSIDKDIPLTWSNLQKVILKELSALKRRSLHNIVNKLINPNYGQESDDTFLLFNPHDITYVESLLGEIIGLQNPQKSLNFDVWGNVDEKITSKSLQEMLDLFHEDFTPVKIMDCIKRMIVDH
ncbi:MAG: hypothetical protein Q8L85_00465 [Alphaproteobacteria bacterium]|nr:hypothetical protein [Alphaproteobacteria bacterium]